MEDEVSQDLHNLTWHSCERPEKCPITTCDYHQRGFVRKYDRNRHVLNHYKGTTICPFCPGSGTAAEKSFNRHDTFKRHLTSVHRVGQYPLTRWQKSLLSADSKNSSIQLQEEGATCSECLTTFKNAQDFYEHLGECVLQVIQQQELSEPSNAARPAAVADKPVLHRASVGPPPSFNSIHGKYTEAKELPVQASERPKRRSLREERQSKISTM